MDTRATIQFMDATAARFLTELSHCRLPLILKIKQYFFNLLCVVSLRSTTLVLATRLRLSDQSSFRKENLFFFFKTTSGRPVGVHSLNGTSDNGVPFLRNRAF